MPSFLDTPPSSDDEPGDAPLDVLASIKATGGQRRRRRHRRNAVLSGLALALVAVPTFAAVGGSGGDDDVRSTDLAGSSASGDDESGAPGVRRSTTSTTAPVTEVAGVVITQVPEQPVEEEAPTPTTARPPRTTVPPTTEAPPICGNSFDPRCGEFHWSPAPGANAPLVVQPPEGPVTVAAGQSIELVFAWSDPDASLEWSYVDPNGTLLGSGCTQEQRFGPWTPPAPAGGGGTFAYTYVAPATPGTYTLGVSASTGTMGGDCLDPYRSERSFFLDVTVTAP